LTLSDFPEKMVLPWHAIQPSLPGDVFGTIEGKNKNDLNRLAEASAYAASLKSSEVCKNPEGLKGGVSGMCKAMYSGIVAHQI